MCCRVYGDWFDCLENYDLVLTFTEYKLYINKICTRLVRHSIYETFCHGRKSEFKDK